LIVRAYCLQDFTNFYVKPFELLALFLFKIRGKYYYDNHLYIS
jgi:hypothetical protein